KIKVGAIYSRLQYPILSSDIKKREIAIEQLKERIELAHKLKAIGVIFVPIFGQPEIPDLRPFMDTTELEKNLLIAILKDIVSIAKESGVKLLLEPVNRKETHLITNLIQGLEIAEKTGVNLLADIYHLIIEEQPLETIIKCKDHIGYVHIANRLREIPKEEDLEYIRPWIETLTDIGYDGYISLECTPPEDIKDLTRFSEMFRNLSRIIEV
ncbi:MAG TPA: sugar phosphate isomerase/epimerase, partial [bacterium]|nr:sugar phosphate isomerase/epimerase [bacterium]